MIKLSVIVPAYNLEHFIEASVLSLVKQITDFHYEVIVCDDASTDSTTDKIQQLAEQHSDLIRPVYNASNVGLAENMLSGLSKARGQYVAYLDGDDLALPGKLQKQVNYLDLNTSCSMVFHESEKFDSDTNQSLGLYSSSHYNWSLVPPKSSLVDLVRYGTFLQSGSVMFRNHTDLERTVLSSAKIILDYPFYILNAGYLGGTIDFIPEVLGRYRIHENSFGGQTSKSEHRRLQSLRDIEVSCQAAAQFGVDLDIINQGISHHRFAAAIYFLKRDNYPLFLQLIEASNLNGEFFNEKHQALWEHRDASSDRLLTLL